MPHFMTVRILYINLLNFSWIKNAVFEEYGAFKVYFLGEKSKCRQRNIYSVLSSSQETKGYKFVLLCQIPFALFIWKFSRFRKLKTSAPFLYIHILIRAFAKRCENTVTRNVVTGYWKCMSELTRSELFTVVWRMTSIHVNKMHNYNS